MSSKTIRMRSEVRTRSEVERSSRSHLLASFTFLFIALFLNFNDERSGGNTELNDQLKGHEFAYCVGLLVAMLKPS
jgi:hypothetical protein